MVTDPGAPAIPPETTAKQISGFALSAPSPPSPPSPAGPDA
ncbi:hypothetical protein [Streptomyces sp. NPDC003006]